MEKPKKVPQSSKDILNKYDFLTRIQKTNRYVSTEHQDYGIRLSTRLGDRDHKGLYMKFAKELPRGILESAASFAIDYPDKIGNGNKGRIYMWKLKELCKEKNVKITATKRKISKKKKLLKTQIKLL